MSMRGFTLVELLVVLAITALAAAIALPRFSQARPGLELRETAASLAADLRDTRARAIASNRPVGISFDPERRRYRIDGAGQPVDLVKASGMHFRNGISREVAPQTGEIRFFPDGSSTGGRVSLQRNAETIHVAVDWLTGRVLVRGQADAGRP